MVVVVVLSVEVPSGGGPSEGPSGSKSSYVGMGELKVLVGKTDG